MWILPLTFLEKPAVTARCSTFLLGPVKLDKGSCKQANAVQPFLDKRLLIKLMNKCAVVSGSVNSSGVAFPR